MRIGAAQQPIDRDTEELAFEVPQGQVYAGDGGHELWPSAGAEVGLPVTAR